MELLKALFTAWGQSLDVLRLTPSDIDTEQLRNRYHYDFTLEDGVLWISANQQEAVRILDELSAKSN